jgi:prepilin-type N-terminal cleavage/methylation domain-containing protein
MTRRGFTLVELLVAMVVMGLLGTALARLLISDSRFVAKENARLDARQTARAGLTIMSTDLRMVTDGGLLAAAPESITVRVPYAFGLLCAMSGANTIGALAPVDSAIFANAVMEGVAWRTTPGAYSFRDGQTAWAAPSSASICAADSIRAVAGPTTSLSGRVIGMSGGLMGPAGTVFYLYQTVTYRFAASATFAGRVALWRTVAGGSDEEILAPFDTTAGFSYVIGSAQAPSDSAPANLSTVTGVELNLDAQSVSTPNGSTAPASFALRTRIKFVNRGS